VVLFVQRANPHIFGDACPIIALLVCFMTDIQKKTDKQIFSLCVFTTL